MGAVIHRITAQGRDNQTFTVHIERNYSFEPYRDFLVCAHCDWSVSPTSLRKSRVEVAGEHLFTTHGADRSLTHEKDASFRVLQWVGLPLCAVFLLAVLVIFHT